MPVTKQCKVLELSRSGVYYMPAPESDKDRHLMRLIDEIHLELPHLGSRGMKNELRTRGHKAGRIHVRTLMRKMGMEAIYRKPRLSKPHPEHKVYPYLLKGLHIASANHVWCSDITYIPMAKGFCYLVAVMDWASRKVLSFRLSNTLDTSFSTEALEEAIRNYGKPDIFNTDQGSQFTSLDFTDILTDNNIKSAWTAGDAGGTTYLSNVSGRRSNTKKCTSRHMNQSPMQKRSLRNSLNGTMHGGAIRVLMTGPRMRSTGLRCRRRKRRYEP